MKNIVKIFIIISVVIISCMTMLFISCVAEATPDDNDDDSTRINVYGGSDPKGDYVAVSIDKTNKTVTHYNYSKSPTEVNGPFSYTKETDFCNDTGFSIIYKAVINADATGDEPAYVLFAEFEGAAVIYVLFNSSGETLERPQYAISRQQMSKNNVYETAFNWMKFKIDPNSDTSTDMECGFAAWDAQSNSGRLYGASYSNRAEKEGWCTNGINNINEGGDVSVDGFTYDSSTVSNYVDFGGTGPDYRLTMVGTPSGATILDFGIKMGGGSGLAIPQSDTEAWNSAYNGTFFIMLYEYDSSTGEHDVKPIKCVLSGTTTGYLEVFDSTHDTSVTGDPPMTEGALTPIEDLSAADSPGGAEKIIEQFAATSDNASANSNIVKDAHECHGGFLFQEPNGVTFIMCNPDGKFGGFIGFTDHGSSNYSYRFGFTIKDENYSNAGL